MSPTQWTGPMPGDVCMKAEDCPDAGTHYHAPKSYLAWHEWAEEQAKTHRAARCPSCGFFALLEAK